MGRLTVMDQRCPTDTRKPVEEQIVDNTEIAEEIQFLVDERDADASGIGRTGRVIRLSQ